MTDVEKRERSIPGAEGSSGDGRVSAAGSRRRRAPALRELEPPPLHAAGGDAHKRFAPPPVDPTTPAERASRQVLASLADAMRAQERVLATGDDPEAVHDLRVAMRRARTILGQLRDVHPRATVKRLRAGLRWLGELTGPVRDRDLLVERLERERGRHDAEERGALDPVLATVRREREQARDDLRAGLASARHARLVEAWARFVAAPAGGEAIATRPGRAVAEGDAGAMPISVVAGEAVARASRRLRRHGRAVTPECRPEELHRVRIDSKKLRYLLEGFRPVFSAVELGPTIDALKALQDCLGAANDAAVHERELRRLALELTTGGAAPPETLLAIGRLIERSRARAAAARRRFPDRFAVFDTKENRRRLRALWG